MNAKQLKEMVNESCWSKRELQQDRDQDDINAGSGLQQKTSELVVILALGFSDAAAGMISSLLYW